LYQEPASLYIPNPSVKGTINDLGLASGSTSNGATLTFALTLPIEGSAIVFEANTSYVYELFSLFP